MFIVILSDGKYFVDIVEFKGNGYVLVETLNGKRAIVKFEDLIPT